MFFYRAIRRASYPSATATPPPLLLWRRQLDTQLGKWRRASLRFQSSIEDLRILLRDIPAPPDLLAMEDSALIGTVQRGVLDLIILRLRKRIHGRYRTQMRKAMSNRTAMLEEMLRSRKLGKLIRALEDRERYSLDLSSLVLDGIRVTEPSAIHLRVAEYFRQWYDVPEALDAFAMKLQRDPQF